MSKKNNWIFLSFIIFMMSLTSFRHKFLPSHATATRPLNSQCKFKVIVLVQGR